MMTRERVLCAAGNSPRVAVVILNFNGLEWLRISLPSVLKSTYGNLDICVVDNGSNDGSPEFLKSSYPNIKLVKYPENLGFAEAYNRALRSVEADYVLLLNSDTQVLNPLWIEHLLHVMARDPEMAAVNCKMVSMEDHSRLDSVGGMGIPYWRGFVDIGRQEYDGGQYGSGFEPFAFCGGAVLIDREVFFRVGGFDGKFFMYVEDADLSWRLRLLGYRVGFAPEATVGHYFSGSARSKGVDPAKLYYCHRNLLRSILKNCGSSLAWALRNYLLFTIFLTIGFSIYEPRKPTAVLKTIFWNLYNFKDTYAWRVRVQSSRRRNEADILPKIYPGLRRYQPAKHVEWRRLLNILFENSQFSYLRKTSERSSGVSA